MILRSPKSVAALCAVTLAIATTACTNASTGDGAAPTDTGPQTATTYQGSDFTTNQPVDASGVTDTEITSARSRRRRIRSAATTFS